MDISGSTGAMTGEQFKRSLNDGRDVWLDGKRIDNVAEHPALKPTVDEFARLLDLRFETAETRATTLFESAETGNQVSCAFSLPKTKQELRAKFAASEWWMNESLGQLGRSPDFMSNVVAGLVDYADELEGNRPGFGRNARNYHRYAMENDLVLTHALGDPQIDRGASPLDDPDLALRVVEEREDGVVLRGAKQLATLAPFSNEVLVYLNGVTAARGAEDFVIWFALPMNAPGLKILLREPLGNPESGHSHPLSNKYDEQDAMLFFDDVFLPRERIFLLGDSLRALKGLGRINAWSLQSTHIRFLARMKFFTSVAKKLAHAIGVDTFRGIQEQLGELVSYAQTLELGIKGAEADSGFSPAGHLVPAHSNGLGFWSADISARMVQIMRQIAASGLIMQPTEADLASPELRPFLDLYMRGHDIGAAEKARLFRLGWELAGSGFGMRQELYEYLHRGDPGAGRTRLLRTYDTSAIDARVEKLISAPLNDPALAGA
ncbi:4-hydroxyphenylacetate 3-hydroxylase family protein [Specibacter cremeus]|uniref:4-hydroxyphenylacetate 3-hydroxylase family protein n=1 Tax=Specibacter cremeus TaxID=1629051 RepID=UPI000F773DBC|nr:4-hydroxyphenylacetate 3-hydroxylase N-terminal domain-containing protein [Specibacter cremeus]